MLVSLSHRVPPGGYDELDSLPYTITSICPLGPDGEQANNHKIQTVYKRNPETNHKTLLEGEFSLPEFEYLARNQWIFTEKVDGTNIRVIISEDAIRFGGRTDNAQIPSKLLARLQERFLGEMQERVLDHFPDGAILYGEGYGAGIQKVGKLYRETQDFVLFDVKVGNWWLSRENVEDVAQQLELQVVPIIGVGTLYDMVELTGLDSLRRGAISRLKVLSHVLESS